MNLESLWVPCLVSACVGLVGYFVGRATMRRKGESELADAERRWSELASDLTRVNVMHASVRRFGERLADEIGKVGGNDSWRAVVAVWEHHMKALRSGDTYREGLADGLPAESPEAFLAVSMKGNLVALFRENLIVDFRKHMGEAEAAKLEAGMRGLETVTTLQALRGS
jgi:hypothetical protein